MKTGLLQREKFGLICLGLALALALILNGIWGHPRMYFILILVTLVLQWCGVESLLGTTSQHNQKERRGIIRQKQDHKSTASADFVV